MRPWTPSSACSTCELSPKERTALARRFDPRSATPRRLYAEGAGAHAVPAGARGPWNGPISSRASSRPSACSIRRSNSIPATRWRVRPRQGIPEPVSTLEARGGRRSGGGRTAIARTRLDHLIAAGLADAWNALHGTRQVRPGARRSDARAQSRASQRSGVLPDRDCLHVAEAFPRGRARRTSRRLRSRRTSWWPTVTTAHSSQCAAAYADAEAAVPLRARHRPRQSPHPVEPGRGPSVSGPDVGGAGGVREVDPAVPDQRRALEPRANRRASGTVLRRRPRLRAGSRVEPIRLPDLAKPRSRLHTRGRWVGESPRCIPRGPRAWRAGTAEATGQTARSRPSCADCHAKLGDAAEARRLLAEAERLEPASAAVAELAAEVYEDLGDRDAALRMLDQALAFGVSREEVERAPTFETLRADPRYQTLVARVASGKK